MIMGGFHLFERNSEETSNNDKAILHDHDIPLRPLAACDLYDTHQPTWDKHQSIRDMPQSIGADIDFTSFTVPTKEEIEDKGKSDWLAKSLVLLQTSYFMMQCIARAIEYLPITHLEIVTLAYAAMNFVIYIFWWNKPLNVNRPVRVFRKSELSATQHQVISRATQHSGARGLTWEEISECLETIAIFIAGGGDTRVDLSCEDQVPRFWANSSSDDAQSADVRVLRVGVCFGAIHCISWGFSFPTHTELLMWRVLRVAITAIPIYIVLGLLLGIWLENMGFGMTVLFLPYIWRYTVHFSSGGHFGFSIYVS